MSEGLHENLPHVLFALLLVARAGDLGTTYLMTPALVLESNPLVRRFGWRFALVTSVVCLVPYVSMQIAVSLLVASLLVAAGNAARVWSARTLGEQAQLDLMISLARRSRLSHAVSGVLASAFFMALVGVVVLLFYSSPRSWGFWIGFGVVGYAAVIGVHGSLFMIRLFRKAAGPEVQPS
jgi:hypothetical protein